MTFLKKRLGVELRSRGKEESRRDPGLFANRSRAPHLPGGIKLRALRDRVNVTNRSMASHAGGA